MLPFPLFSPLILSFLPFLFFSHIVRARLWFFAFERGSCPSSLAHCSSCVVPRLSRPVYPLLSLPFLVFSLFFSQTLSPHRRPCPLSPCPCSRARAAVCKNPNPKGNSPPCIITRVLLQAVSCNTKPAAEPQTQTQGRIHSAKPPRSTSNQRKHTHSPRPLNEQAHPECRSVATPPLPWVKRTERTPLDPVVQIERRPARPSKQPQG